MRLLTVLAVLTRLLIVWPLQLLWWLLRLVGVLINAVFDGGIYLLRLLMGGVLRPLGHRFALIGMTLLVFFIGAYNPRMQNPSFYVILGGGLLICFLSGKFGKLLLPKRTPKLKRLGPFPGWPSWPPMPKPPPVEKPKPEPVVIYRQAPVESQVVALPTGPERPTASAVRPTAVWGAASSPSEEEAVAALPEALQRLMQPKTDQVSGGPTAGKPSGRPVAE